MTALIWIFAIANIGAILCAGSIGLAQRRREKQFWRQRAVHAATVIQLSDHIRNDPMSVLR